jgi:multiple sugar transport system permease protein
VALNKKFGSALGLGITYAILAVALFITLFPILWTFSTSFKIESEFFSRPPVWIPTEWTLEHYQYFLRPDVGGLRSIKNSSLIAGTNALFVLLLTVPGAYAIVRYRTGGNRLMMWFLSLRMMPPVAPVLPLFILFLTMGKIVPALGIDRPIPLVLTYTIYNLPFAIWLLVGFFEDFPQEIQDQAMVDGCTEIGALIRVIMPILAPGIAVVGLFCFIFAFNDLLFAVTFTRGGLKTLMVLLTSFNAPERILYGVVAAGSIIGTIPAFVIALFFQRYLVKGLAMGGLKG